MSEYYDYGRRVGRLMVRVAIDSPHLHYRVVGRLRAENLMRDPAQAVADIMQRYVRPEHRYDFGPVPAPLAAAPQHKRNLMGEIAYHGGISAGTQEMLAEVDRERMCA